MLTILNNSQAAIIKDIVDYINTNIKDTDDLKLPELKVDELSVRNDSICITTTGDTVPTEKLADVTGLYVTGSLTLSVVYRKMLVNKGNDDLKITNELDTIIDFISQRKNYKNILNDDLNYFVSKITVKQMSRLDKVFDGGVKDFKGIIVVEYERRK